MLKDTDELELDLEQKSGRTRRNKTYAEGGRPALPTTKLATPSVTGETARNLANSLP